MGLITPVQAFWHLRAVTAEEAAERIFEVICNYITELVMNGVDQEYMETTSHVSETEPTVNTRVLNVTSVTSERFRFFIKDEWITLIGEHLNALVRKSGWTSIRLPFSKEWVSAGLPVEEYPGYNYYKFKSFQLISVK